VWSEDCEASESDVHSNLEKHRLNFSREFFSIDVDRAVAEVINCAAGITHFICAVESDRYVDESFILQMADCIGISARKVCEAIEAMTQKDVEALVARVDEDRAARIAASNAKAEKERHEP
jgi:hypothetical protein